MRSTDKTSSVWSIYSEKTGTPFAACNFCSSKIKRGKEWPGIIFKRKCLLFISLATIFSYARGKKWKFPAKSGRQKIYPRNTRFRSGKIRLTGNKIEIRLFPVRQRNHGTGRFLSQTTLGCDLLAICQSHSIAATLCSTLRCKYRHSLLHSEILDGSLILALHIQYAIPYFVCLSLYL